MKWEDVLARWLRMKALQRALGYGLSGLVLLALGILALVVTFWIVYISLTIVSMIVPHTHETRLIVSGAILLFLFVADFFNPRAYYEEIVVSTPTGRPPITLYVPGVGLASTINPLATDTMSSAVKIFATCLTFGPRLIMAAFRLFFWALAFVLVDTRGCARVLAFLARKNDRVPYEDIVERIEDEHAVKRIFLHLRLLDAVTFLSSQPPGVKVHDEWQKEIRALKAATSD